MFDIIYTGTDAVNVTDAMNAGIKATQASVLSKVTKLMDEGYYKDIDVRKLTEESYAKLVSGLESCGEFNDIFSAVNNVGKYVQYANDIETLVYRMAKIEAICGQSKEYAEVLRDMSKNTTDETLAAACDEMASICDGVMSAKLMDAIMTGEEVVTNVSKWVTDKIWDYVIDSLGACGIGVTAGQAVGKWASGLLFSTDKTIETYYEMSALYNFDNAIRKVVKKYERQYSRYSSDSVEYAKKFNASVELMLKTQELGCDISIKDAEYKYEKGIANVFVSRFNGKKEAMASYKKSLQGIKKNISFIYTFANGDLYNCYKDEYCSNVSEDLGMTDVATTDDGSSASKADEKQVTQELIRTAEACCKKEIKEPMKLTGNVTYYGDVYVSSDLDLNGYKCIVYGNLIQSSDTLTLNGGTLDVSGDYRMEKENVDSTGNVSYSYGYAKLIMTNSSDIVNVGGTFENFIYNWIFESDLQAGVMSVKGDFIVKEPSNDRYCSPFKGEGTFKTILNGNTKQMVCLQGYSGFNELEILNNDVIFTSDCYMEGFKTNQDIVVEGGKDRELKLSGVLDLNGHNLIINGDLKINGDSKIYGYDPSSAINVNGGAINVNGDLELACNVDLKGGEFLINGNLLHSDGNLNINGGTLDVSGDYRMEEENVDSTGNVSYSDSRAKLIMTNSSDIVNVGGTFENYMQDRKYASDLQAGVMSVKGDFIVKEPSDSCYRSPFKGEGTFKTILNGNTKQMVCLQGYSGFNELEILNNDVIFTSDCYMEGFKTNQDIVVEGGKDRELNLRGVLDLNGHNLIINGDLKIEGYDSSSAINVNGGAINVNGDLELACNVDLKGGEFLINGNLLHSYDNLNINGGTLDVSGDYRMERENVDSTGNVSYSYGYAKLIMTNSSDIVNVGGTFENCIWNQKYDSDLQAGVMSVKGDFIVKERSDDCYNSPFKGEGTFKTILNGNTKQMVCLQGYSGFNELEILNNDVIFTSDCYMEGFKTNQDIVVEGGKDRELNLRGVLDLNGHNLIINGDLKIDGGSKIDGYVPSSAINVNGGGIKVNGDLELACNVDLKGGEFLINGNLLHSHCNLNINGGTVKVTQNFRMERRNEDLTGNISYYLGDYALTMRQNNDYILIDGNFEMYADDSVNDFSAGTLEVHGDFILKGPHNDFNINGTNTVILNGLNIQKVQVDYSINNLYLTKDKSTGYNFVTDNCWNKLYLKTKVDKVTVSPELKDVCQGEQIQYSAQVSGINSPSQDVTWAVTGAKSADTHIDENGLLSVGEDEKAATLIVTATSVADPAKSASVNVKVEGSDNTKVVGYSVGLSDMISLNMYTYVPKKFLSDAGANAVFTLADGTVTQQPLSEFKKASYNGVNTVVINTKMVPAYITRSVTMKIVGSDGKESEGFTYSIYEYAKDYIKYATTETEYQKALPLVKAMLDYGAYSQLFFGVDASNLANYDRVSNLKLTEGNVEQTSCDSVFSAITNEETGTLGNEELIYQNISLICESETSMKLYFQNKNNLTLDQIKEKYAIKVYDSEGNVITDDGCDMQVEGEQFWIKIKNLGPVKLSSDYTIEFTSEAGTQSGTVSPICYIKKAMKQDDMNLQNLCKAMYLYNKATLEYIGQ